MIRVPLCKPMTFLQKQLREDNMWWAQDIQIRVHLSAPLCSFQGQVHISQVIDQPLHKCRNSPWRVGIMLLSFSKCLILEHTQRTSTTRNQHLSLALVTRHSDHRSLGRSVRDLCTEFPQQLEHNLHMFKLRLTKHFKIFEGGQML